MIKAKTGIKLLRHLGIVLIALPEPITTPFGVAFIVASRYLSKRREAHLNKRFRETFKHYLAHFNHFRDDAGESGASERVKRYTRSEKQLTSYQGSRSVEANPHPSAWQSWGDTGDDMASHHSVDINWLSRRYGMSGSKVGPGGPDGSDTSGTAEETTHHTINMGSLSRRFPGEDSSGADADSALTSGAVEGAVHHAVNMELLSQRYDIGGSTDAALHMPAVSGTAGEGSAIRHHKLSPCYETDIAAPAEARHHTINMAALLRRYGSALGATPPPSKTR